MAVTIRQAGNQWLIEVHGKSVATASTEAEARVLADQWAAKLKWVPSWRFAPDPTISSDGRDLEPAQS